jgi:hypothetical protein
MRHIYNLPFREGGHDNWNEGSTFNDEARNAGSPIDPGHVICLPSPGCPTILSVDALR